MKLSRKFREIAKTKIAATLRETQNFDKIILNFAKFEGNFAKREIKNSRKISQNYENKNFAATLCRSGVRGGRGGIF